MTSGRRPVTPPRGRVTLAQAASLSGLSYQEVHRRVTVGTAPAEQDDAGVWTMLERDALKLERRHLPPFGKRPGTNLRAAPERWASWEREAERRGMAVSTLAGELLDEVSGWSEAAGAKRKP